MTDVTEFRRDLGEIKKLVKGTTPTLLEAKKGNELIQALNALSNIRIERGTKDEVIYGDDEIVITYGNQGGSGWAEDIFVSTGKMTFLDGLLVNYIADVT